MLAVPAPSLQNTFVLVRYCLFKQKVHMISKLHCIHKDHPYHSMASIIFHCSTSRVKIGKTAETIIWKILTWQEEECRRGMSECLCALILHAIKQVSKKWHCLNDLQKKIRNRRHRVRLCWNRASCMMLILLMRMPLFLLFLFPSRILLQFKCTFPFIFTVA